MLQNYSKGHLQHVKNCFRNHLDNKSFQSPLALQKYIQDKPAGKDTIVTVARLYLKFLEQTESLPLETLTKYRNVLNLEILNQAHKIFEDEYVHYFEDAKRESHIARYSAIKTYTERRLEEIFDNATKMIAKIGLILGE